MKKALLTLSLVSVSAAAFGQGKITFANAGTTHLITIGSQTYAGDGAYANKPVPVPLDSGVALPSGANIVVSLYAGSASGGESLITTLPVSQSATAIQDGAWAALNINLPTGIGGGALAYFTIFAYDGAYANQAAANGHGYWGEILEFTATPGVSVPVNIITAGGTTIAAGPLVMPNTAPIPEPATLALAGIGAAAMLIFRRRK